MAEMDIPMNEAVNTHWTPPDRPLLDATPYGYDKNDSISDATENAAITHKQITLNGKTIPYTARPGHLVTTDLYSAQKSYVSLP
jgi:carboxypeptidase C (cathepsin A)